MRNRLQIIFPESGRLPTGFSLKRSAALFTLFLILFFIGIYTEQVYAFLDQLFRNLFTIFGFDSLLKQSQAQVSDKLTMRSWPTMLTYGLLYTALSFLILHVYLNNRRQTKLCFLFYASVFIACVFLIGLGKLIPGFTWAYMLCRRLIEMIVSPFPVILLLAVFAGFSPKPKSGTLLF